MNRAIPPPGPPAIGRPPPGTTAGVSGERISRHGIAVPDRCPRPATWRSHPGPVALEAEMCGEFDGGRTTRPVGADGAGGRAVADQMDPRVRRYPGCRTAGHGDPAARAP